MSESLQPHGLQRFFRQEYWSGLPFPSPGNLPYLGIEPGSHSLQADSLPSEPSGKPTWSLALRNTFVLFTFPILFSGIPISQMLRFLDKSFMFHNFLIHSILFSFSSTIWRFSWLYKSNFEFTFNFGSSLFTFQELCYLYSNSFFGCDIFTNFSAEILKTTVYYLY